MQLVGDARNELRRDIDAINLAHVFFDFARAEAARVKRKNGFAEITDRRLVFGDGPGFKAGIAVARRFDFDLAEITAHGFGADAIA